MAQPVRFRVRRINEPRSSLELVRGGKAERLAFGTDATINLRGSSAGKVDAPLVFIGYGLVSPEHGLDDLRGLDLKGKVAVVLAGAAPGGIPGPALAAARAAAADALGAAGAIGIVTVASPHADIPWERYALSRLHPQMRFAADTTPASGHTAITVVLNHARAERVFAGAPQGYAALQALADSGAALPRFDLPVRLRATVAVDESDAVSDNVVGLMPGGDPAVAREYVALTGHLDHLGVASHGRGRIYNGAMDNASGIATLLEAATSWARRRPIRGGAFLFVAVTAEEKGLLGSDWFAEHPPIPQGSSIVADLNADMFLPLNPLGNCWSTAGGVRPGRRVRRAAAKAGIEVIPDPEPRRNAFVRSDQFNFIRRHIPRSHSRVGSRWARPGAESASCAGARSATVESRRGHPTG